MMEELKTMENMISTIEEERLYTPYLIDVTRDVKEPAFTLKIDGVGCAPKGNILAIKAKAKQGKTQLTKIIMASAICGKYLNFECTTNDAVVLYVDTEMGNDLTTLTIQSVLKMCGTIDARFKYNEPCDRLKAITLRTQDTCERWNTILQAIEDFTPDIVIIDGIRDLIEDINDIPQSNDIILKVLKTSEEMNCAIWNILHENKNDGNMRGHVGTELLNKCFEVFEIKKDAEQGQDMFNVEQTDCRWKPISKFNFMLNEYGMPVVTQLGYQSMTELEQKMKIAYDDMWERHNNNVGEDGRPLVSLKKKDFLDSIMSTANVKSVQAYKLFNQAYEQGIIWLDKVMGNVQFSVKKE